MPCIGFICPKCLAKVPLEEAVEHLGETCAVMYGAVVQSFVNSQGDERRGRGAGVSASIMSPDVTCRRQLLIQRYLDYWLDPRAAEEAEEGSVIHHAMHARGSGGDRWGLETPLPGAGDMDKAGVRRNPIGDFLELELWPDVWVSGIVDRHLKDWSVIEDLKTKRAAKVQYPPSLSTTIQLNILKLLAERLGYGPVGKLYAWTYQRGCYEASLRHRRWEIQVLPEQMLRQHSEKHARTLAGYQMACEAARGLPMAVLGANPLEATIKQVPMDGKDLGMFNGKKCIQYCEVNQICFGLAGEVTW